MVKENAMKQTEIGLIPKDWTVYTVLELIDLLTDYDANGSFSSVAENVKSYNFEEYAWYVRSTDLENNSNLTNVKYVDKSSYDFLKKTSLYGGELLFLKRGDIGNVYLFEMRTEKATLAPNLYLLKLNKVSSSRYLYQYFISEKGQAQFKSKNAGSTLGALYKDDVKSMLVPLPPLPEQEAIAEALNDADAWIESLELLIAKKRLIKQGAMQELLKPNNDWELVNLGENFSLKARIGWQGLTTAEYQKFGKYCLVTGTDFKNGFIKWESCVFVEKIRFHQDRNIQLREKDVLVTKDGTIGKVAYIESLPKPTTLNSGVFVIRPKNNFNNQFLYYILMSSHFDDFLEKITAGSTITHLYQKDFIHFKFKSPKSLNEQTRIATILSNMDAELEALEAQLAKARQVKQGMMQELLTGRTRLINSEKIISK